MRIIGQVSNEAGAKVFGGYLASLEIKNLVEPDSDGSWSVWIYSEDQLEKGRQLLAGFLQNPNDPKFHHALEKAAAMETQAQREQKEYAGRVKTRETLFLQMAIGPLTLALIGGSVLVAFLSKLGGNLQPIHSLFISEHIGAPIYGEIQSGEIWRLLTPMFIHYGLMHLLFNMLWLKDLGTMIEARQGTIRLAAIVVVTAALSNLGQLMFTGDPRFGGMSGVVYGLFGYIWIRGKCDPASRYYVDPRTVTMMVVWFFLCLFGIIPHVANAVHGIGFAVGIIWGGLPWAKNLLKV